MNSKNYNLLDAQFFCSCDNIMLDKTKQTNKREKKKTQLEIAIHVHVPCRDWLMIILLIINKETVILVNNLRFQKCLKS